MASVLALAVVSVSDIHAWHVDPACLHLWKPWDALEV